MPRPVKLSTFSDLIHYHLSLYYIQRERYPHLKHDLKKHYKIVLLKEKHFHQDIERRYPEYNTEENKGELRRQIDFLTGVFTKAENTAKLVI